MAMKCALLHRFVDPVIQSSCKVTIVGAGSVGLATAFSILCKGISNDIVMLDNNPDKLKGEAMDLQQGTSLLRNSKICYESDYAATAGSKVCVITAGGKQAKGQDRLSLLKINIEILREIIPKLVKFSPDTILVLVTNPVDILTYSSWVLSGLPMNRVIGTGTSLDSARFKYFIGQKLGVPPSSVHAWIIGEHGDTSVPVWSSVNVGGVRLIELNPAIGTDRDEENWKETHKNVVNAAYDLIKLKGYTSWAIGLCAASFVESILLNSNIVMAASTYVKTIHGIKEEVFLSLPVQIGANGVTTIVKQSLTERELTALKFSADKLFEVQNQIKLC